MAQPRSESEQRAREIRKSTKKDGTETLIVRPHSRMPFALVFSPYMEDSRSYAPLHELGFQIPAWRIVGRKDVSERIVVLVDAAQHTAAEAEADRREDDHRDIQIGAGTSRGRAAADLGEAIGRLPEITHAETGTFLPFHNWQTSHQETTGTSVRPYQNLQESYDAEWENIQKYVRHCLHEDNVTMNKAFEKFAARMQEGLESIEAQALNDTTELREAVSDYIKGFAAALQEEFPQTRAALANGMMSNVKALVDGFLGTSAMTAELARSPHT